jgi:hypothetical protein
MKRRRGLLVGVILASLVLAGCEKPTSGRRPEAGGVSPAVDQQALLGRWIPIPTASPSRPWTEPPYVHFVEDGTWHGADGCNSQSGRWTAGAGDAFEGVNGPATQIGCDNVEVGRWLGLTKTVNVDSGVLTLRDASGAQVGRLRRVVAG